MDLFYDTWSTILGLHLLGIINNDNKISKPKSVQMVFIQC